MNKGCCAGNARGNIVFGFPHRTLDVAENLHISIHPRYIDFCLFVGFLIVCLFANQNKVLIILGNNIFIYFLRNLGLQPSLIHHKTDEYCQPNHMVPFDVPASSP